MSGGLVVSPAFTSAGWLPAASLDVSLTSGGVFDAANPAPETGPPIGTGTIAIERIVLDKVPACEAAQP